MERAKRIISSKNWSIIVVLLMVVFNCVMLRQTYCRNLTIYLCFVAILVMAIIDRLVDKEIVNVFFRYFWVSFIIFMQVEVANKNEFILIGTKSIFINLFYYFVIVLLVHCLAGMKICIKILSVLFSVGALIIHYVYCFRGMTLTWNVLMAAGTAFDVIDGYKLFVDRQVIWIIINGCLMFISSLNLEKKSVKRVFTAIPVLLIIGLFFVNKYTSDIIEVNLNDLVTDFTYWTSGYAVSFFKDSLTDKVMMPSNYVYEQGMHIDEDYSEVNETENVTIIMVVNESFYNLGQVTDDFETDVPVTPFIDSLENVIRGCAINPNGTTANSEYEILTGQTMAVTQNAIPFLTVDMTNSNSWVKQLDALGYITSAYHTETGRNYNREHAYKELGFNNCYFYSVNGGDGSDAEKLRGNTTDRYAYNQVIDIYESNVDFGKPQFIYCLTVQNHGGWQKGGIECNINIINGIENSDENKEFLACMNQSDAAFEELVGYFSNVKEPVVICMVGDHAPYIAEYLYNAKTSNAIESKMRILGTPLIVWSNYGLEECDLGYVGMNEIQVIVSEAAGNELSSFQKELLSLRDEFDVIGRDFFVGSDGVGHLYSDVAPNQTLQDYFSMCYYNLKK